MEAADRRGRKEADVGGKRQMWAVVALASVGDQVDCGGTSGHWRHRRWVAQAVGGTDGGDTGGGRHRWWRHRWAASHKRLSAGIGPTGVCKAHRLSVPRFFPRHRQTTAL